MTTIADIRAKYPDYDDMSDLELARSIHAKFYKDKPLGDFLARIGLQKEAQGTGEDVIRSAASYAGRSLQALPGLPGSLVEGAQQVGEWGGKKLGMLSEEEVEKARAEREANHLLPRMEETQEWAQKNLRQQQGGGRIFTDYEPATTAGEWAATAGEMAPTMLMPGGLGVKAAQLAGATAGSELAGRGARKLHEFDPSIPDLEPYARMGGAIAGGGLYARPLNQRAVRDVIPSTQQFQRMKTGAYDAARASGNQLDTTTFSRIINHLEDTAEQFGGGTRNNRLAPRVWAGLDTMRQRAAGGQALSVDDIDKMRQSLKMGIDVMKPQEKYLINNLIREYDRAVDEVVPPALREARRLNVRYKKSQEADSILGRTEVKGKQYTQSGDENAIRAVARQLYLNIMNNPRKAAMYSQAERDAIHEAAMGGSVRNAARWLGKFAPTSMLPIGATAGLGGLAGAVFGPAVGAGVGGGITLAGLAGRGAATGLARRDLRNLDELLRGGRQGARTAQQMRRQRSLETLIRALVGGASAGSGRPEPAPLR